MADEIWDGKSSLVFNAEDEQLTAITLDDDIFYVQIAREDFRIVDETLLDTVFATLKKTVSSGRRRPFEQLTINKNMTQMNTPAVIGAIYALEIKSTMKATSWEAKNSTK